MIKLICSDLDGTLIGESYGSPSEELFDMVKELREKGVIFCLSTGRQFPCVQRMFREVEDGMYFIANNGGSVHLNGETLRTIPVDESRLDELIDEILAEPDFEIDVTTPDYGYTSTANETFFNILIGPVGYIEKNVADLHHLPQKIIKVAANYYGHRAMDEPRYQRFKAKYGDLYDVVKSGNGWMDFMGKGVGKGHAVQFLMDRLGLKRDEVAVFGDNQNDVSMFEVCDYSYCMSTATEDVKKKARFLCDDAVAEFKKILTEVNDAET